MPVTLTLASTGSRLLLPLLAHGAASESPVSFAPGVGSQREARTRLSATETRRSLERDYLTGRETLTVVTDDGLERIEAHGLVVGRRAEERYSILPEEPLSASIEAHWTMRLSREDWQVRTETFARMTATADAFAVTASLSAFEGGKLVAERSWEVIVPREGI